MRIIVLDESKSRTEQMVEILQRKKYDYVCCSQTGQFFDAINEKKPDKLFLDYEGWCHGRMVYNFFGLTRKLDDTPVVVYNAPENFVALTNRKKHENDRVFAKAVDGDTFSKVLMEL
jgi:DNA-binding response OmpR family regulator